ncbi:putative ABC transporter periplasmic solute-binding protein [Firmicutes bacterium CAG:555]|nr:putative ABC transporter periplasmic solute-binding protein [Firmicutes bacterium CAG:555]
MKRFAALLLALAMVFALCACSNGDTGEKGKDDQEVINWDYLSIIPTSNPAMKPIVDFVNEVKEATNGRLVITIREPGELPFTNSEYVRAIGEGSAQMGWGLMPSIAGDLNGSAALSLPFMIQNSDDLKKAMDAIGDTLSEELGAYGADTLFYFNMPAQNLFGSGTPVKTFSDAQKLLIRATGSEMSDFINSIGGVPVTIDNSEVPTSLSRGVVNSVITSALNCYGNSWNENLDWAYMFNLQADTVLTLVNKQALQALPDDVRATLLEISAKYTDLSMKTIADAENDAIAKLKEAGMTFTDAAQSDVDAKVAEYTAYWDTWAQSRGGNAVDCVKAIRTALGK